MDSSIKWSETLNKNFENGSAAKYTKDYIIFSTFRPYIKKYYYSDPLLSDRLTDNHLNCIALENKYIAYSGRGHNHVFSTLASEYLPELDKLFKSQKNNKNYITTLIGLFGFIFWQQRNSAGRKISLSTR
jgi:predicted helicase